MVVMGLEGVNYVQGEPLSRTEVEVILKKLKNGKAIGKDS